MGDSLTSWLQNLFSSNDATQTNGIVPSTPGMAGSSILSGAAPNTFNTDSLGGVSNGLTGLQLGQLGLGLGNGLLSGYLGFQNLGLAKDQARQAQKNWNKQWAANVKNTNAALEDRQKARVASNPNAYESVDSYMKKYGIK
nr:MAG: hypothetical protein [Bacteriophage sp.]